MQPDLVRVVRVRFTPAPAGASRGTLVGYVSFVLEEMGRLDGLALHRAGPGRYGLNYPGRKDQAGRRHPFFRPKNQATREAIEREVIEALRARGVIP